MYNTQNKQGEKRMRVRSLLAASAALALMGTTASAGFQVSAVFTPGGPAGFDVYRLFAKNDGLNGTGTDLQSVDVTMQILTPQSANVAFQFADADSDGVKDANIFGLTGASGFNVNIPQGSYVRVGGAATFATVSAPGPAYTADPDGQPTPGVNPETDPQFTNAKSFRVAGFQSGATKPNASTGNGAQFGAVVVPTGAVARLFGGVAGSAQGSPSTEFDIVTPEPSSMMLLGIGAMALGGRVRRRRA
jgi:hypothetical protein